MNPSPLTTSLSGPGVDQVARNLWVTQNWSKGLCLALVILCTPIPLQLHAQWSPAGVTFHGIDRKHIRYSLKGLELGTNVQSYAVGVKDPQGKVTVTMVCGSGSRLVGMTAFDPENQALEAVPDRVRHFPHAKNAIGFDIMGNDTDASEPRWMIPSTYADFVQGLRALLWSASPAPASQASFPDRSRGGPVGLATTDANSSERNSIRPLSSGTNRFIRVLFRGLVIATNSPVLLPETVVCSDATSTAQRPIVNGTWPLVTSDGFTSSESILDNLTMANRAPVVVIRSPHPGDQGTTNTLWSLEASVTDVEDQEISGGRWVSSLDGVLGSSAKVSGVRLRRGTHILSFTAQDSQQAAGTAQVTVTVGDMPTLDLAVGVDSLRIKPNGLDPSVKVSNQLRIGRSHTIVATVRNQGITNTAQLKLFIQEPGKAERLLSEKKLDWPPFATDYVQTEYTPAAGGEYRFRVQLESLDLTDSNPANNQYTWIIANLPPQAISLALDVESSVAASIGLLGSDPEESPLTYTVLTNPKHGTLTGTPPKLTYVSTGYAGLDSFTFKVNDGQLDSPPATITLNVTSSLPAQFTITGVAGAGGSLKPSGSSVMNRGESLTFTATPRTNPNYEVDKWYLNGAHIQTGGTGFVLTNIQNNAKVEVSFFEPSVARQVMVIGGAYGRTASVSIRLVGKGKENQFGFGLSWRPNVLRFDSAQLGSALTLATLDTLTNEASLGRVSIKIRLPQGTGLSGGTLELLRLQFTRMGGGWSPLSFTDQPVWRWMSDLNFAALPSLWIEATIYVDDVPNIPTLKTAPITADELAKSGFSFTVLGPRYHEYRTQYSSNLVNWLPLRTDNPMTPELLITDPGATNGLKRFYRVLMQP